MEPEIELVHTTKPGGSDAICGAPPWEEVVPWEQVNDPKHPSTFSCGKCWLAISGVEPMGGSLLLSAAHEVSDDD